MKVKLSRYADSTRGVCTVTREEGDPKFYNPGHAGGWGGSAESRLMYHIKKALIAQGHDVIKKRAWKDGHLLADTQQYIRSRHPKRPGSFWVIDEDYAVRDLAEDFNRTGQVELAVEYEIGEEKDEEQVPVFYECGICGAYHRAGYKGDCRDDAARFDDVPANAMVIPMAEADDWPEYVEKP